MKDSYISQSVATMCIQVLFVTKYDLLIDLNTKKFSLHSQIYENHLQDVTN